MGTVASDWNVYLDNEEADVANEVIEAAYLGKIHLVMSSRNAWHGSTAEAHFRSTVHSTALNAQCWVEGRRKQGSSWTIREFPAIIAAGATRAALVAVFYDPSPLKENFNLAEWTLPGLLAFFRLAPVIRVACSRSVATPAKFPFRFSRPSGGETGH